MNVPCIAGSPPESLYRRQNEGREVIHDCAGSARPGNENASGSAEHGDADERDCQLPFQRVNANGDHRAHLHARVPLSHVYGNAGVALSYEAIPRLPSIPSRHNHELNR